MREPVVDHHGAQYHLEGTVLEPKPSRQPTVWMGGFVIRRDTEAEARAELDRVLDVRSSPDAYASYQDFIAGSQLESRVSLEEYSVSNRGLRAGLVGTPERITERIQAYERAGAGLMLLQFSPQREQMARFGEQVISGYPRERGQRSRIRSARRAPAG